MEVWRPQPRQQEALSCPADEILFGGARGGGKSDWLLADFTKNLGWGSSHRGILFRRSYPELEELKRRSYDIYLPIGAQYAAGTSTWTFPGGSTLKLRFLAKDTDVHKYQGHQYSWIGFDELTNWPSDYCYIYMFGTARSAEGAPIRIRASGNPGSVGHMWVKQRFIDGKIPSKIYPDKTTQMARVFIPAKVSDNLILMKNDPQYVARLKALPPKLQKAHLEGDWSVFAGQVFEEWDRDVHVIKPEALDPHWGRIVAMDWGYAKPYSVGWYAVSEWGKMIRYREMYGGKKNAYNQGVEENAATVARRAWNRSVIEGATIMVADPHCWTKNGSGPSIAETFRDAGFRMIKGNNDRESSLQKIHDLFKEVGTDGEPLLQCFSICEEFIRVMPQLVYDAKKKEDVDTNQEDHIYDELRYAVMSPNYHRILRSAAIGRYTEDELVAQDYDPLYR